MFYILTLQKDLDVHPRFFGKNLREYVHTKLIQEVGRGAGGVTHKRTTWRHAWWCTWRWHVRHAAMLCFVHVCVCARARMHARTHARTHVWKTPCTS